MGSILNASDLRDTSSPTLLDPRTTVQPDPLSQAHDIIIGLSSSLGAGELDRVKSHLLALLEMARERLKRCSGCPRCLGNVTIPSNSARLSRRENEVMSMLLEGKRLKEIAALLNISVKTVTTHRARLMRKLAVEDNLGLYRYGIRHGLIDA